jgi:hypothetical protein
MMAAPFPALIPSGLLLITDFIKSKKGAGTDERRERPMTDQLPTARGSRLLTAAEFHSLADVPPEVEWFANLSNPSTRRAYETAVRDFVRFTGIARPEEFRTVTRAHIIAWRDTLKQRGLGGGTIRHRLASRSRRCSNISATGTPASCLRHSRSSAARRP